MQKTFRAINKKNTRRTMIDCSDKAKTIQTYIDKNWRRLFGAAPQRYKIDQGLHIVDGGARCGWLDEKTKLNKAQRALSVTPYGSHAKYLGIDKACLMLLYANILDSEHARRKFAQSLMYNYSVYKNTDICIFITNSLAGEVIERWMDQDGFLTDFIR